MTVNQTGIYSGNLYQIIEDIANLQTENAINKGNISVNKTNIKTNTDDINVQQQNMMED